MYSDNSRSAAANSTTSLARHIIIFLSSSCITHIATNGRDSSIGRNLDKELNVDILVRFL